MCTFDPGDGVLAVLGLMLCSLPLGRVLHRMLVHAGVSRQQAHVVLLTVVTDGPSVSERLLHSGRKRGDVGVRGQSRQMFYSLQSFLEFYFLENLKRCY